LSSPERQLKQPRKSFGSKELENRGIEETQPNKPTTLIERNHHGQQHLNHTESVCGLRHKPDFRKLMHELGLAPEDTGGSITFVGKDPACCYQPQRV
jgi:hypothetical protein